MSAISKAIAATIGAVFAILAVFGLGDGNVVFGLSQDAVLSVLTPIAVFIFTYFAPKNST